ncbi:MAG: hypothetical protein M1818_003540 [Claussenomyces sp. TS43310]|nr:MAG: hypothetical protein M1818_003540 [Claussenomyces sp. TS43310]
MTDYNALKVPDLKKLLGDRALPLSGNKADLIARLQEDDKKPTNGAAAPSAPTGDDEIDWDEDDPKATTAPAAAAIAAGGQGQVANPVAVPNQKADIDPAKTSDLMVEGDSTAESATASTQPVSTGVTTEAASEDPKVDFSMGIQKTHAEKEAERRAARAKRFGISEDEEEKKRLDRAKKFGTETASVVKGLDDALPERRKRGREGGDKDGRGAKRQTPDRRAGPPKTTIKAAAPPAKKPAGRIVDDPAEKAKAEARAKRFQTAA